MIVSFNKNAAAKQALEALRQYPLDSVLFVAEISENDYLDEYFGWDEAEFCKDFCDVADLLNAHRSSFRLGLIAGLRIVAVDYIVAESGENAVCLFGVREKVVGMTE